MSIKKIGLVVLGILCLVWIGTRWANAAPSPSITRRVSGSGGGRLEQGIYSLDNTLGQPVVGRDSASTTSLCAGFWCKEIRSFFIYIPLVLRGF
jgi:hypothetical protein